MATAELNKVIGHLRNVLRKQDAAELADGDLLKRYLQQRDETAFEALVRRHGPMVLDVCRRILRNPHDAEDAFQATFLVLLHKASSLRSSGTVGNWLYGVAYRTGQEARRAILKRQMKEAKIVPKSGAPADALNDLRETLDEELERLPEKYRTVIVLSDLEGATGKEVALRLGVPEGTVASRLARGRAMLAKRLTRTGVSVTAGALASVLSHKAASACVPPPLVASTVKAVSLFASEKLAAAGLLSANVASLTQGVLKTMLLTKLKIMTAALLVGAVSAFGGGLYMHKAGAQQGPGDEPPAVAVKSETEKGGDPIPSSDDLRGNWKGEKNGVKVDLTFTGEKAHWQVDFVKTRKPKEAYESPNVGVGIGADLKCAPDVKAGRLNLYLPAYLGNDKELKKHPVLTGRAPVGEITRGADRTIQLRIIPSGYENLDQVEHDYPAVEGLILRRTAMNDMEKLQGAWVAVSGEERGVQVLEERLKKTQLTLAVKGDRFALQKTGQAKGLEGTLKIDQARQPKTMDWSADKPDHAKGIYHLEGDTLKFCYGTDRLTEFKTTADP